MPPRFLAKAAGIVAAARPAMVCTGMLYAVTVYAVTVYAGTAWADGPQTQAERDAEARAATFGLGAIVGVAAYNALTMAATVSLPAAAAPALGVAGAIGASSAMVWVRNTYNGERTEFAQLLPVSLGALAGVAAGDAVASTVMGYSPFAAAAGGVMPTFGFSLTGMASGLYTYTTGVMGARVADAAAGIQPEAEPSGAPNLPETPSRAHPAAALTDVPR